MNRRKAEAMIVYTKREHPWLRKLLCRAFQVHTAGCDGRLDHQPRSGRWTKHNIG